MKVLIDCSNLVKGGVFPVALSVIHNAVRTRDHEWHLALSGDLSVEVDDRVSSGFRSVLRLAPTSRSWRRIWQIRRLLPRLEQSIRPDLVYTVFGPPYWDALAPHLVGFALPAPLYPESVTWKRLNWAARLRRRLTYYLRCRGLRWSDYLYADTEIVRQRLERVMGFPSSRVFVARNSYSPLFKDGLHQPPARDSDSFLIFVPSAYYPHKNLELIPDTAALLAKLTDRAFEFVLTLPPNGQPWSRIQAAANAKGVGHCVRTLGVVPHAEIARFYQIADAVFLPTFLECSTSVYPESFAAEVPLCTSDLDFARELCGDAALYFDPCSAEEAAKALLGLLLDEQLRADLVQKGRKSLAANYSTPEQKWHDQLKCMEEVVQRSRGSDPSK